MIDNTQSRPLPPLQPDPIGKALNTALEEKDWANIEALTINPKTLRTGLLGRVLVEAIFGGQTALATRILESGVENWALIEAFQGAAAMGFEGILVRAAELHKTKFPPWVIQQALQHCTQNGHNDLAPLIEKS